MFDKIFNSLVNKRKKHKQFLAIFGALLIGIFLGMNLSSDFSYSPNFKSKQMLELDPFWRVWDTVNRDFVLTEQIDPKEAVYGAIKGMVFSLQDPHSDFMTPNEATIFKGELNQEIQGIGAEISLDDGLLTVITPLKNSPAEIAGIKPGDKIIKINGEDATGLGLMEGIFRIRGKKGTQVTLSIYRQALESPIDIVITRDKISLESITSEIVENNIYYVSINQFSKDTTKEFLKVVNDILLTDPKGIILDLRNNGGGYLDMSVDILGEFLPPETKVLTVKTGADQASQIYKTAGASRLHEYKVAILINEGSASASEILAGAMQDLKRATVIGKTSYGKGTVQEVVDFPDGSSLRLTIAQWFTPNNRDLNQKGVTPDITVEKTDNTIDQQLRAAIDHLSK